MRETSVGAEEGKREGINWETAKIEGNLEVINVKIIW